MEREWKRGKHEEQKRMRNANLVLVNSVSHSTILSEGETYCDTYHLVWHTTLHLVHGRISRPVYTTDSNLDTNPCPSMSEYSKSRK